MKSSWELQRNWEIVRYLVYYLVEDFLPPELIRGRDVVDFSSGLGDLSVYIQQQSPKSLISTSPDDVECPPVLKNLQNVNFIPKMHATQISNFLSPESVDVLVARMVFQFPTSETDRIDVDGMLSQIFETLRPGGQLVISSHEYTQLDDRPESWNLPLDDYFREAIKNKSDSSYSQLGGLIELIREISIPPREGVHGQTGFGLKGLMAVDSFVKAGFIIEEAAEIEDFTFPIGITQDLKSRQAYYQDLADKVFAIKRTYIRSSRFDDKYQRPQILQKVLLEINELHPFVSIPIFRIQARKPVM